MEGSRGSTRGRRRRRRRRRGSLVASALPGAFVTGRAPLRHLRETSRAGTVTGGFLIHGPGMVEFRPVGGQRGPEIHPDRPESFYSAGCFNNQLECLHVGPFR